MVRITWLWFSIFSHTAIAPAVPYVIISVAGLWPNKRRTNKKLYSTTHCRILNPKYYKATKQSYKDIIKQVRKV